MKILRRSIWLVSLVVIPASLVQAQVRSSDSTGPEASSHIAAAAGRRAADEIGMTQYFVPAFIGGAFIGVAGLFLKAEPDEKRAPILMGSVGLAVIATTATSASRHASPAPIDPSVQARAEYLMSFESAFADRLRQRRRNAMILGSLAGAAAGVAAIYRIFAS